MMAEGDYPGERETSIFQTEGKAGKWKSEHNIFRGYKPLRDTAGAKIYFGEVGCVGRPEGTDLEEARELSRDCPEELCRPCSRLGSILKATCSH